MSRMIVVDSPPGIDEPVEPVELLRLAHLDDLRAEPAQHRRVLAEVALEGEDADAKRLRHRQNLVRPLPAGAAAA